VVEEVSPGEEISTFDLEEKAEVFLQADKYIHVALPMYA